MQATFVTVKIWVVHLELNQLVSVLRLAKGYEVRKKRFPSVLQEQLCPVANTCPNLTYVLPWEQAHASKSLSPTRISRKSFKAEQIRVVLTAKRLRHLQQKASNDSQPTFIDTMPPGVF